MSSELHINPPSWSLFEPRGRNCLAVLIVAGLGIAGCKSEESTIFESDAALALSNALVVATAANNLSDTPASDEVVLRSASCVAQNASTEELAVLTKEVNSQDARARLIEVVIGISKRPETVACTKK